MTCPAPPKLSLGLCDPHLPPLSHPRAAAGLFSVTVHNSHFWCFYTSGKGGAPPLTRFLRLLSLFWSGSCHSASLPEVHPGCGIGSVPVFPRVGPRCRAGLVCSGSSIHSPWKWTWAAANVAAGSMGAHGAWAQLSGPWAGESGLVSRTPPPSAPCCVRLAPGSGPFSFSQCGHCRATVVGFICPSWRWGTAPLHTYALPLIDP